VYSPISLVSRKLTDQYSNNLFFSESSSSKRDTPLPFLAIPSPTEKSFAIRAIVVFQVREISKKYPRMFFFMESLRCMRSPETDTILYGCENKWELIVIYVVHWRACDCGLSPMLCFLFTKMIVHRVGEVFKY